MWGLVPTALIITPLYMEALTGLEPARTGLKVLVLASLHSMLYLLGLPRRAAAFLAVALPFADRFTPVADFRFAVALPFALLVTEARLCGIALSYLFEWRKTEGSNPCPCGPLRVQTGLPTFQRSLPKLYG